MPLDHYVSQVHLRNFYSPELSDKMYAFRKSDGSCFTPNSSSVCGINDGSTNKFLNEERIIEDFLETIEPHYDCAVDDLLRENISTATIYVLAGFVSYVLTCSPTGGRLLQKPLEKIVKNTANFLEKHGNMPPLPKIFGDKSIKELFEEDVIQVKVDSKYPQAICTKQIFSHLAIFGNCKWDILINNNVEDPFFTTDFPIGFELTKDPVIQNKIVPLRPNVAIKIIPSRDINTKNPDPNFSNFGFIVKEIRRKEVVDINRLLVKCADRMIFSRDKRSWTESFIKKYSDYHMDTTINEIPAGKGNYILFSSKPIKKT